jgi:hypothetical protein
MARTSYREGDWFGVPLVGGGCGAGIIARAAPGGALFGYFFGPRRPVPPRFGVVEHLQPKDAALLGKFGHLGLKGGSWPILGRSSDWDRAAWPMPRFVRREELTGRVFRVYFDEDNPVHRIREEQVAEADVRGLPRAGLMGAEFVEAALARALSQN